MATIEREANQRGFVVVRGISDRNSLVDLARSLGSPIESRNGDAVKELRVTPCAAARPRTFSAAFGTGGFPLHTDTAFWATPARFLVMRVAGDTRRPTLVYPLSELFLSAGKQVVAATRKSVWMLRTSIGSVYSDMFFRNPDQDQGVRYDRQCMVPANVAAHEVDKYMSSNLSGAAIQPILWSDGIAVVIANWRALHGRGPEPPQERERVVERIYVE